MSRSLWVHIVDEPDRMEELAARLDPRIRVTTGAEPPEGAAYDILVAGVPERGLIEASPNLSTLVIPWAGVPNRTRALMSEFPRVSVHNLHHNAVQVAEMAVALLLAAAKRLVPMDAALRRGDWSPRYEKDGVVLLAGKRALVLGYGALGRSVARLLKGLGMTVTGVRRRGGPNGAGETAVAGAGSSGGARSSAGARPEAGATPRTEDDSPADAVRGVDRLNELLPSADALVVCLPLTNETRGLVGAGELALLPPRAVLVNVGRGPVVDERALYEALKQGTLHAAGLDVWYNYPTDEAARASTRPSGYPFHELDNVVMSPHRAGAPNSAETESMRARALAELLNAAVRGGPVPNAVDLERGY